MKVNTTQTNNLDFEYKLSELREIVEPQFKLEFGNRLGFFSIGTGDPDGRLTDGGFLMFKGDPAKANLTPNNHHACDQWIHSMAQAVGFGGAYRLNAIPFSSTGLIVYRVYDR